MLLAPLLAILLHVVTGCQNIQLYFGHLPSSLELESFTLPSSATSCSCCGLCHQNSACKSLMFNQDSRQCILYNTAGGPADFDRQSSWNHKSQFFFMPNSSLTNEFCRSDSDCVTAGDFCRGRICTTETTVTCRDLYLLNNGLTSHRYWGFIAGQEILLDCSMGKRGGYTQMLRSSPSSVWTVSSRLNSTTYESDGTAKTWSQYSILWAADFIRDSSPDSTYTVVVTASRLDKRGSDDKEDWINHRRTVIFTASKSVSILDKEPREVKYTIENDDSFGFADGSLSFPYLLDNGGEILLHANMDVGSAFGGIIRSSGKLRWSEPADYPKYFQVHIRE